VVATVVNFLITYLHRTNRSEILELTLGKPDWLPCAVVRNVAFG